DYRQHFWDAKIQPKLVEAYKEMEEDYTLLLKEQYLPALDNSYSTTIETNEDLLNRVQSTEKTWNNNPTTLLASYIEEVDTYLSFLEKVYIGHINNNQIDFGIEPFDFSTVSIESEDEA